MFRNSMTVVRELCGVLKRKYIYLCNECIFVTLGQESSTYLEVGEVDRREDVNHSLES